MSLAQAAQRNRQQNQPSSKPRQPMAPTGPFKPSKNLATEWPEVFEKRMLPTEPKGRFDRGPTEAEQIVFRDPRPDLEGPASQESFDWARLLAEAWPVNRELAITLHGFRCQGSRLVKTEKGYVIKPEVGEQGWASEQEYQEARDKYLVPHREQLTRLLKSL